MSLKVCGGSLRHQIALAGRIGFRMPLLAAEQSAFVSGHRFSDAADVRDRTPLYEPGTLELCRSPQGC